MSHHIEPERLSLLKEKVYSVVYEHFQSDISEAESQVMAKKVSKKAVETIQNLRATSKMWDEIMVGLCLVVLMIPWVLTVGGLIQDLQRAAGTRQML
jgi:hypothetical protein